MLGFETRISLREGIERTVAYLRSRGDDVGRLLAETQRINWVMSDSEASSQVRESGKASA
jgi:hypothetical protein